MKVVVVGHGSIGRRHGQNALALGCEQLIVVRRAGEINAACEPPPSATIVHSAGAALALRPQAALICTPTRFHLESAEPFVTAGVPTLIEKPLAHSFAAAEAWASADPRRHELVSVAYCLRAHPAYQLARTELLAGRIGKLIQADAWFESYLPDWHPWEDYRVSYAARRDLGGGVLPTVDHELDFLNWCLGHPQVISAQLTRTGALDCDVADVAWLALEYPDQVPATLRLSMSRRDRQRGFAFVGTAGTLRFDWNTQHLQFATGPASAQTLWHEPAWDVNRMYLDLLADFLTFARAPTQRQPPTPLSWGLATLRGLPAI